MEDYYHSPRLRLRSYESGYVIEKRTRDKFGDYHWQGILWYSSILSALTGLSDYLLRKGSEPLPMALLNASDALDRARKAVFRSLEEEGDKNG